MIIKKLEWDSGFFNMNVGKADVEYVEEFDWRTFKEIAKDENYDLIYVFCDKMLPGEIVNNVNLDLVDVHITMTKSFNVDEYRDVPYNFMTLLSEAETQECHDIAVQTSSVSRFYNEKPIGPLKTKELYKKWVDNALNQSFADGLFIQKRSGHVAGIHIIRTDVANKIGQFTLTGVDRELTRSGIGRSMWLQSFGYWANECEIEFVRSPFSLQNSMSFNFHTKMGFNRVEKTKYIYHYRKSPCI